MKNYLDLSLPKDFPSLCTACVEISAFSKVKYEIDKETNLLRCDRILSSSVHYPQNYGFIPQTLCPDGDPADVIILTQAPLMPLTLVDVRPIGVLSMLDNEEEDDKFLAVNVNDPQFQHVENYKESFLLQILKEIEEFFRTYKNLENKTVQIGSWSGVEAALELLQSAHRTYKEKTQS
jgi:inorganic pyrophosphatase